MMQPADIGPTLCKCPKCRGGELTATEYVAASMDFTVSAGRIVRAQSSEEFGEVIGLRLKCRCCGNRWTPRRAQQITNLVAADAA